MLPQIYLKQSPLSSIFETKTLSLLPTEVPILYCPAHLGPSLSQILHSPQDSLSVRGLDGGNKQGTRRVEIWMDFSAFLLHSAFKFYSVERVCAETLCFIFHKLCHETRMIQ